MRVRRHNYPVKLRIPFMRRKFLFLLRHKMVTPAGFEPAIFWMRTRYPKPLDEGAIYRCFCLKNHNTIKSSWEQGENCQRQFARPEPRRWRGGLDQFFTRKNMGESTPLGITIRLIRLRRARSWQAILD